MEVHRGKKRLLVGLNFMQFSDISTNAESVSYYLGESYWVLHNPVLHMHPLLGPWILLVSFMDPISNCFLCLNPLEIII
jgi:hypothetical protein